MTFQPPREALNRLLNDSRLWFMVGLGSDYTRPAYRVAEYLQNVGKTIVPIYPREVTVLGQSSYRTIADAAHVHGSPDVVEVFVRSSRAGEFADEAVRHGASAVWFPLDVIDHAAAERVATAGRTMVMDRCPVIEFEHPKCKPSFIHDVPDPESEP